MKKYIILLSIFCSSLSFGQTEEKNIESEYSKTLKEMFIASGTEQNYKTVVHQLIEQQKQFNSDELFIKFLNELEQEIIKNSIEELTVMLTPVYAKYFTINDLKEIIKFYNSPIGKKLSKNTPNIAQESMKIGAEWGQRLSAEIINRFQQEAKE